MIGTGSGLDHHLFSAIPSRWSHHSGRSWSLELALVYRCLFVWSPLNFDCLRWPRRPGRSTALIVSSPVVPFSTGDAVEGVRRDAGGLKDRARVPGRTDRDFADVPSALHEDVTGGGRPAE